VESTSFPISFGQYRSNSTTTEDKKSQKLLVRTAVAQDTFLSEK
jgi:hypothetical protein